MEAEPDIGRLVGGKPGEAFERQVYPLSGIRSAGVEHHERSVRVPKGVKHLLFCLDAALRRKRGLQQFWERVKAIPIDPMRDDGHCREIALALFLAQPAKGPFELRSGELRVDDDAVGLFERRRVLFVSYLAVQWDVADDLQPVSVWTEDTKVILEHPDIVQDKDQVGVNLLDQALGLEGREDIPAFRIGRMDRQTAIAHRLAGVADAEKVNLMAIGEPPHDRVHHPRQTGAGRVIADGDVFHTSPGTVCTIAQTCSLGALSRFAKNNPSPSGAPVGRRCLWYVAAKPASLRKRSSTSMVYFAGRSVPKIGSFDRRFSLISR